MTCKLLTAAKYDCSCLRADEQEGFCCRPCVSLLRAQTESVVCNMRRSEDCITWTPLVNITIQKTTAVHSDRATVARYNERVSTTLITYCKRQCIERSALYCFSKPHTPAIVCNHCVCIGSGKALTLVQKNVTLLQDSVTAIQIKETLAIDSLSTIQLNNI